MTDSERSEDMYEMIGSIDANVKVLLERTAGMEKRIRSLELARNWLTGAIASLGTVFGWNHLTPAS